MNLLLPLVLLSFFITACSTRQPTKKEIYQEIEKYKVTLDQAEEKATSEGRSILTTGRSMILQRELIPGSCWNYIDAVYGRAGFSERKRMAAFKGKLKGPYTDNKIIQPGDWLYYINHSYKRTQHSGIFIDWIDFEKKKALIMSYAGENRQTPARYKVYKLKHVYNVIRPK